MLIRKEIKDRSEIAERRNEWELTESPGYYFYDTESGVSFGGYNDAEEFIDGLAIVQYYDLGHYGVINEKGETVIPFMYNRIIRQRNDRVFICEGVLSLVPEKRMKHTRSYSGVMLVEYGSATFMVPTCYYDVGAFSEGLLRVARGFESGISYCPGLDHPDLLWGFINDEGEEIIACEYEIAHDFHDGLAFVKKDADGMVCFIDNEGNIILKNINSTEDFHEGLCRFSEHGKYGFIDSSGKVIIPAIYSHATNFKDGLSYVVRYGEAYISPSGALVWNSEKGRITLPKKYCWYELLDKRHLIVYTHEAPKDEMLGVIDIEMNEIVPCKYDFISIDNGQIKATLPPNKKGIRLVDWYSL